MVDEFVWAFLSEVVFVALQPGRSENRHVRRLRAIAFSCLCLAFSQRVAGRLWTPLAEIA
jgi:hypothetical protein